MAVHTPPDDTPPGAAPLVLGQVPLRRALGGVVCALAGVKAGLAVGLLAGASERQLNGVALVVQAGLAALVAAMVVLGRRVGLGFGAVYLGYSAAVALIELPPTGWKVMALATNGTLLVAALALWTVDVERPPPARTRLVALFVAGLLVAVVFSAPLADRLLAG
jgi:hypothetical protein